jgi:hypothetical protein
MRRTLILFALFGILLPGQQKKVKSSELEVLQITVHRQDDKIIGVDGSVRNNSPKPFTKMQMVFEFFAPGKQSITIQKGPADSDDLQPGDVVEFHLQLRAPARAVTVLVGAENGDGRELKVGNGGPFAVE